MQFACARRRQHSKIGNLANEKFTYTKRCRWRCSRIRQTNVMPPNPNINPDGAQMEFLSWCLRRSAKASCMCVYIPSNTHAVEQSSTLPIVILRPQCPATLYSRLHITCFITQHTLNTIIVFFTQDAGQKHVGC